MTKSSDDLLAEVARLRAENADLKRRRKFGLVWENQPEERIEREMRERLPVLKHLKSLDIRGGVPSPERPHILIEGDNLHALTVLQTTHRGAVDLIYIDPPYNTGSDFTYNDKRVAETDTFRHSSWLSFMDKRLRLARPLLTPTGVIAISIDDHEQGHLRLLADQVFGEGNFIAQMVWNGGRKNDSRYVSVGHDYVLVYARDAAALKYAGVSWRERKGGVDEILAAGAAAWAHSGHDPKEATRRLKAWFKALPTGHPALGSKHYNNVDDQGRVFFPGDISWPGGGGPMYDVIHPVHGVPCKPPSRGWAFTRDTMDRMTAEGRIHFGDTADKVPNRKSFLSEIDSQVVGSVFYKDRRAANKQLAAMIGAKKFDFPKDPDILAWLISLMAARPDTVVLDFFAGSGSAGHAVAALNAADGGRRQAILVTNNEAGICRTVTQPRLKAALTGSWADGKPHDALPGSVRFYVTDLLPKGGSRDALRIRAAKALTDLLAVRENTFAVASEGPDHVVLSAEGKRVVIWTNLFDDRGLGKAIAVVEKEPGVERVLYAASAGLFGVDQALVNLTSEHADWRVEALPEPFIRELEKAQATAGRKPR